MRNIAIAILFLLPAILFAASPGDIVVNEIMYNSIGSDEEWVELYNTTDSDITLDADWTLSDNMRTYTFEGVTVPAGGYLTIEVLTGGSFPFTPDVDATGHGIQLSNTSDEVILRESGVIIDSVKYHDSWGDGAHDGDGPSLERIDPAAPSNSPENWNSSTVDGGTPGAENSIHGSAGDLPPVISGVTYSPTYVTTDDEVLVTATVTDDSLVASVILYHGTDTTSLSATEMLDDGAHGDGEAGDHLYGRTIPPYTLGDTVYSRIIATDNHSQEDTTDFYSFIVRSPIPTVSDVVINEIMYNSIGADTEWVELLNRTDSSIDISGYTMKDNVDSHQFVFPDGTTIPAHSFLVVCEDTAAITARFGITNVIGNFTFGLNNSGGDWVRIFDPEENLIDLVAYLPTSPWPEEANGGGPSLELIDPSSDNNDPANWRASEIEYGTPGTTNSVGIDEEIILSKKIELRAYPNPFNSSIRINTSVEAGKLLIYNLRGEMVQSVKIEDGQTVWDGCNLNGEPVPTGIYIVRIDNGNKATSAKILFLK